MIRVARRLTDHAPVTPRAAVVLAYAAFVLVGLSAGVGGVLLPEQIRDYGVDKATIGATFFTFSAGFLLAGSTAGALIHRLGIRLCLVLSVGVFALAGGYTASRPPLMAFIAVQVLAGYGVGLLESALNTYLTGLPSATTRLNRLHAFFGVGALLGPLLATWLLGWLPWTATWLVLALVSLPLLIGFQLGYPSRVAGAAEVPTDKSSVDRQSSPARQLSLDPQSSADRQSSPDPQSPDRRSSGGESRPDSAGGLGRVLRQPGVLLAATFLAIYVGLEIGMGTWGFSFLVDARSQSEVLAGYTISGYWLGLTLGRFLISPIATRIGLTTVGMSYACLVGVTASSLLAWLAPTSGLTSAALVLLGFFLGPLFPTTMAVVPQLTSPGLVPTAIGFLNGVSVVGGAVGPWLAGVIAQGFGAWTLLPFIVTLAVLQLGIWWLVTRQLAGPGQPVSPVRRAP